MPHHVTSAEEGCCSLQQFHVQGALQGPWQEKQFTRETMALLSPTHPQSITTSNTPSE